MCDNARECRAAERQGFVGGAQHPFDAQAAKSTCRGLKVRLQRSGDGEAIRAIHSEAFESDAEARLVDALGRSGDAVISLVAVENAVVAGHVLLSKVTICESPWAKVLCLAPIAVRADSQGRGVGSALVTAALDEARHRGWDAVVVLGHPAFYPRFGFVPAAPLGIMPPWPDVPDDAWMIAGLREDVVPKLCGVVSFPAPFDEVV